MRQLNRLQVSVPDKVKFMIIGAKKGTRRPWDRSSNVHVDLFKATLRTALSDNQDENCAYCLLPVGNDKAHRVPQIDHFVPWAQYPEWTFEPDNLVLACGTCNEDRKHAFDTLKDRSRTRPMQRYSKLEFSIVHPYLSNVSQHIVGGFSCKSQLPEPIQGLTTEGIELIRLFKLDSLDMKILWEDEYYRLLRKSMSPEKKSEFESIMDSFSR